MAEAKPKKLTITSMSDEVEPAPVKKTPPKAAKTVDDETHTIAVKVKKKPAPKPVKPSEPDDIPEELLPTSDELDLKELSEPGDLSPKEMEEWFDDLDTLEAPDRKATVGELADQADLEPVNKQGDLISPQETTKTTEEPDKGQLKGFIADKSKQTKAESHVHPAGQEARESLASPKVFDTNVVHKAIDPDHSGAFVGRGGRRINWLIVFLLLVLLIVAYAAIDVGLLGDGVKVPWHIFS